MYFEFTGVFYQSEGWWIAQALEYPGAMTQGKTLDEARENLKDAFRELILSYREQAEQELAGKEVIREVLMVEID